MRSPQQYLVLAAVAVGGGAAVAACWWLAASSAAAERDAQAQRATAQVLAAARSAREVLPRALGPADRLLSQMQARQSALAKGDRREAEQLEQGLVNQIRRGQDGIRLVAATDASGNVAWASQSGVLPAWVGNLEFFMGHRYGRVAASVGRSPAAPGAQPGIVMSRPLLGREGGFAGIALVMVEPGRLAQQLPGAVLANDPVLALYHMDGALVARGRGPGAMALPMQLDPRLLPDTGGDRTLLDRDPRDGHAIVSAAAQLAGHELVVVATLDDTPGAALAQRAASTGYALSAGATVTWLGLLGGMAWRLRRREEDQTAPAPAERPSLVATNRAVEPAPSFAWHGRAGAMVPQVVEAMPNASYAARVSEAGEVHITATSPALERLTGWPPAVFRDLDRWHRNIDWASYPPGQPLPERLLMEPEAELEYRFRRADGSWIWLRESCRVVARDKGDIEVLGCLVEVTREHELVQQAEQATRAATQGMVAAGLAHDLKQPLQVISYAAQNGLEALANGEDLEQIRQRLVRVVAQSERASAIARQLGDFTRLEAMKLEPVALAAATRSAMAEVTQQLQEAGVEVQLRLPEGLPPVRGRGLMVEQVLVNLCLNARDAMMAQPEGQRRLRLTALYRADTDQVELVVADTGGGVPEDVLERVFEMHFTTKERGKGSGLGLTLCRFIMSRFGGTITMRNQGAGAEVRLSFRRAQPLQPTPTTSPVQPSSAALVPGGGTATRAAAAG